MKNENQPISLPPISGKPHSRMPSAKDHISMNEGGRKLFQPIPSGRKNLKPIAKQQSSSQLIPFSNDDNTNISKINNNQNINEETKSYIEDMKKGTYNILVCVRCRPLSSSECNLSNYETIRIMDSKMVVLLDPIEYNGPGSVFKNRSREQTYAFDFAFDKNCSQQVVFENSTKFLIDGVVNGYNATVFAYGATGAGKTYTMLGTDNNPGIMPLTLKELFNKVNSFSDRDYKLKFWYLEIYNENIRDLLKFLSKGNNSTNPNDDNEYLDLREDPVKGIMVSGITEVNISNSSDMLKILKRGNRNRTQEATGANETSSRSHAILQVAIEYKEKNSGIDYEVKYSKLSLIDLAGSERASATQNRGIRLIEGANINRSLLTLGNCINALCDAMAKGIKKPYVPYRDSKLTRLLKDSLGGNARTVMIANVSPSINTFDDTYNTLKYANRAKNIKTVVVRNTLNAQYHISNYVNIINNLKAEVIQLKQQLQLAQNSNNHFNNINNISNTENVSEASSNINFNNNINLNVNKENEEKFSEAVTELKKYCDSQVAVKQKIISLQNEISKVSDVIEMNKNINAVGNDLSFLISGVSNNINSLESDKKYNYPNTDYNTSSNNTNNSEIIYNNDNSFNRTSYSKKVSALNEKMSSLQKTLSINQNRYKEYGTLIEKSYNKNVSNFSYNENQKDYLLMIMKNSAYKIQMIDNKYNSLLNNSKHEIKDEYIKELEKQIKLRDEVIQDNNIDIFGGGTLSGGRSIKGLEVLQNEYKQKIPKIKSSQSSGNILPPVSGHSSMYGNISFTNPNNMRPYDIKSNKTNNSQLNRGQTRLNTNIPKNNNSSNFGLPKNNSNNKFNVLKNVNNNNYGNKPNTGLGPKQNINNSNKSQAKSNKSNRYSSVGKGLQRNNKSSVYNFYNYKDPFLLKNINKGALSRKGSSKGRRKSPIEINIGNQKQNKSFCEDDSRLFGKIRIGNNESDRLITMEQMPQVKKSDLNYMLNERNKKRKKFLDKINGDDKDL